jgi:hypothetical protein
MREGHWLLSTTVCAAVVFCLTTLYISFHTAVVLTVIVVGGLCVLSVHLDWTDHPVFPPTTYVLRIPKGRGDATTAKFRARLGNGRSSLTRYLRRCQDRP